MPDSFVLVEVRNPGHARLSRYANDESQYADDECRETEAGKQDDSGHYDGPRRQRRQRTPQSQRPLDALPANVSPDGGRRTSKGGNARRGGDKRLPTDLLC